MKKTLLSLSMMAMAVMAGAQTQVVEVEYLNGDMDGDQQITVNDASGLINAYVKNLDTRQTMMLEIDNSWVNDYIAPWTQMTKANSVQIDSLGSVMNSLTEGLKVDFAILEEGMKGWRKQVSDDVYNLVDSASQAIIQEEIRPQIERTEMQIHETQMTIQEHIDVLKDSIALLKDIILQLQNQPAAQLPSEITMPVEIPERYINIDTMIQVPIYINNVVEVLIPGQTVQTPDKQVTTPDKTIYLEEKTLNVLYSNGYSNGDLVKLPAQQINVRGESLVIQGDVIELPSQSIAVPISIEAVASFNIFNRQIIPGETVISKATITPAADVLPVNTEITPGTAVTR